MKKVGLLIGILIFISTITLAQGVKALWITTSEYTDQGSDAAGFIISFDSIGNNYQERHELPHPPAVTPTSLNFYNGKFYGIDDSGGRIFEYDPSTGQSAFVGQLDGSSPTPRFDAMTLKDDLFYGVSTRWPSDPEWEGYLFTWNPISHVFTKRDGVSGGLPAGPMVEKDGKLYGMISTVSEIGAGYIFEWDTQTDDFVVKINFSEEDKGFATGSMILLGEKFYGACSGSSAFAFYGNKPEDPLLTGCLFEWDPVTNDFNVKYDFNLMEDGSNPAGNLIEKDGRLYGVTLRGGINDAGVLFEFDPVNNVYSKKADLSDINGNGGRLLAASGGNLYGYCNFSSLSNGFLFEWNATTGELSEKMELTSAIRDMLVVAVPVSSPMPGNCEDYPAIQIDESNNNQWVAITDSKGDVLAELHSNSNNLGVTNAQSYVNNTGIRTDGAGRPYLDRSITIIPSAQPAEVNPVDIRLYITKSEFNALKSAPNSGISDIEDIAIFKSDESCSDALENALPIPTTYEDYDFGYVLKATITSFSTFYFSNKAFEALPLEILAFTATLKNNDVLLQWTTEHEYNTSDFDIERSTDGIRFITVGNIAAFNNTGHQVYNFKDENAGSSAYGRLYYRLKQKDLDGKYEYSKTIIVSLPAIRSFVLNPNPAQNFLDITFKEQNTSQKLRLQITDLSGKKVLEQIIDPAVIMHRINIASLSKGVYFISILNNGKRTTGKFVKQ